MSEPLNLDEARAAWEYWVAGNGGEKVALDEGVTHLVPALLEELRETRAERDGYKARGRVYEGKVKTLREGLRAVLAEYDVTPTLRDFNAALEESP